MGDIRTHIQRTHRHTVKHKHLNSLIACGEMGMGGGNKPCICLTAEISGPLRKKRNGSKMTEAGGQR